MNILFFGSTTDSVIILDKLFTTHYSLFTPRITAIVTQPPRPVGRKQLMTPTPVETWAKTRAITVLSFPSNTAKPWLYLDEAQVVDALEPLKADLIVSASYGQKIPAKTLKDAKFGGLNVHPSLLPRWRGGDPVPWAIMTGDHQTGVTIVSLSEKFEIRPDTGKNPGAFSPACRPGLRLLTLFALLTVRLIAQRCPLRSSLWPD